MVITLFFCFLVLLLVTFAGVLAIKNRDGWPIFLIIAAIIAYFGLLSGAMQ